MQQVARVEGAVPVRHHLAAYAPARSQRTHAHKSTSNYVMRVSFTISHTLSAHSHCLFLSSLLTTLIWHSLALSLLSLSYDLALSPT